MIFHDPKLRLKCCDEEWNKDRGQCINAVKHDCTNCHGSVDKGIMMHGYCSKEGQIFLCLNCSKQLARKLLEDICDIDSKGGRHG